MYKLQWQRPLYCLLHNSYGSLCHVSSTATFWFARCQRFTSAVAWTENISQVISLAAKGYHLVNNKLQRTPFRSSILSPTLVSVRHMVPRRASIQKSSANPEPLLPLPVHFYSPESPIQARKSFFRKVVTCRGRKGSPIPRSRQLWVYPDECLSLVTPLTGWGYIARKENKQQNNKDEAMNEEKNRSKQGH